MILHPEGDRTIGPAHLGDFPGADRQTGQQGQGNNQGKKLFDQDVYINVAGGLALSDPAADLAVCVAVASSLLGFSLPPTLSVMGEVGLCGEVRPVAQVERRVAECVRLGFTELIVPKQNMKSLRAVDGVHITGVDTLMQALAMVAD